MFNYISEKLFGNSIPYSYRQTVLDIVDYIVGKNVFNRKQSLM